MISQAAESKLGSALKKSFIQLPLRSGSTAQEEALFWLVLAT